ncbi:hypothetical protein L6R52_08760, partial [Myxococcota bacterium]|nr:hypothetical protein [Myxococcota bacterium]
RAEDVRRPPPTLDRSEDVRRPRSGDAGVRRDGVTEPATLAARAARAWAALGELDRAGDAAAQPLRTAFVEAKAAGDDDALEAVVRRIEAELTSRTPGAR